MAGESGDAASASEDKEEDIEKTLKNLATLLERLQTPLKCAIW